MLFSSDKDVDSLDQYSLANMIVKTRTVIFGSIGSGEPPVNV
jgi:hypothetical protein